MIIPNLLSVQVFRHPVLHHALRLALDQRESVSEEIIGDIVSCCGDPFLWEFFLLVADQAHILRCTVHCVRNIGVTLEGDHLFCLSGEDSLHTGSTGLGSFLDISLGYHHSAAALVDIQLDRADFDTEFIAHKAL